ncbi:hypothetical protein HanXRQr2_Chr16g0777351 [Helianthus annuus]|uniref:Uncharacterized protein n=1 Tax=Helianthus annuus TaxID=4232 RepID=A0A9K3DVU6_HELAN|nr:hypothetical protein HanXRQr2_Chr16g0777351 [Helianthus annuus]
MPSLFSLHRTLCSLSTATVNNGNMEAARSESVVYYTKRKCKTRKKSF